MDHGRLAVSRNCSRRRLARRHGGRGRDGGAPGLVDRSGRPTTSSFRTRTRTTTVAIVRRDHRASPGSAREYDRVRLGTSVIVRSRSRNRRRTGEGLASARRPERWSGHRRRRYRLEQAPSSRISESPIASHVRGAYLDETIGLFRHLWSGSTAPFEGRFHTLRRLRIRSPPRPGRAPADRGRWSGRGARSGEPERSVTGITSSATERRREYADRVPIIRARRRRPRPAACPGS